MEGRSVILAIAALLLHVPAVPQNSLPKTSSVALVAENSSPDAAGGDPADSEPVAAGSSAASQPAEPVVLSTRLAERPVVAVAFEPGRLIPTPVAPASPEPEPAAPAAMPMPEPLPASPAPAAFIATLPTPVRTPEQAKRAKQLWLGLSIAQHSAAVFDAWSTRRVVSSGDGQELNPLLHPFAGNASLYVVTQVTPVLLDFASRRMMNSHHDWERRTWWVPQSLSAAMSFVSGVHNLGVH
jgi:hypothetical protein